MLNIKEAVEKLRALFRAEQDLESQRDQNFRAADLPTAFRDERDQDLLRQISRLRSYKEEIIDMLVRYPPQHIRHSLLLERFHQEGEFEQSVFIMTKFPEGEEKIDAELDGIIKIVSKCLVEYGYVPRIALDSRYHMLLWDNVELFLLGCSRGVAIVEGRYKPELNPNVTMEWGWMRGMGRDVLFLQEKGFDFKRADLAGLSWAEFRWEMPDEDIRKAIQDWLAP